MVCILAFGAELQARSIWDSGIRNGCESDKEVRKGFHEAF